MISLTADCLHDKNAHAAPDGCLRAKINVNIGSTTSEIGQQFTVSVGIFAQGLFSGITSMGARAISQTEQGLREERNRDKRNRIEWKE